MIIGFSQSTTPRSRKGSMKINEKQYEKYLTVRGLGPKSIKTYIARYKILGKWLRNNGLELSKRSVEDFLYELKQKGYSSAGVNSYLEAIKHLDSCHKSYGYDSGFTEDLKSLPKKRFSGTPLSLEESDALINTHMEYKKRNGASCDSLDLTYRTVIWFQLVTGCRPDEATSLTVNQLDIDNGRALLVDTKNHENRFLFFDGPIKVNLRQLTTRKKPDDLVFMNSKGKKIHSGEFGHDLKKRAIQAGIKKHVNPHLLRHTYATLYYNRTHDIAMTAKLLGHKDMQVTYETYVFFDTEGIRQGASLHPLIAPYISIEKALKNYKKAIDQLGIDLDHRLEYQTSITENELTIKIKTKA